MNPSAPPTGLSSAEARQRLQRDGANVLPGAGPRHVLVLLRDILTEPMFLLLIAAAALYMVLGKLSEAMALSVSVLAVITITLLQERRTEHTLARLRDLSVAQARVIRDGIEQRLATSELVLDDLILLHEGERIPADADVLQSTALSLDESLLTGESLPVDKGTFDQRVYSGTLVLSGFGTARVTATGAQSEIGKIGHAISTLSVEAAPLYQQMRRMTRWIALSGLLVCLTIAVLYALSRHDVLGGALAGITMAMSMLPEEFPVVLTVFMAMGAWRIAAHGVLVRRMPAIETIGAVTVLAVDKTGTLTENRMQVVMLDELHQPLDLRNHTVELHENARAILFTALAASERNAFDAMEQAIHAAAQQRLSTQAQQLTTWSLVQEYDLTPELLAVTHVWQAPDDTALQVMVKGAPETVLSLCHADAAQRQQIMERVALYADQGLRMLAVAQGSWPALPVPESPREFSLQLLGLIGLADPLRDTVPAALAECRTAGIRVLMITGDHAGTARAIATQAGIDVSSGIITGAEIDALDDAQLAVRMQDCNVYARMTPTQKLRLVQALKANDEIVAMTGDGVNDAPALKAAHVGVALGTRSTTVAREAASLVLVKDDFASLVTAVRLGRRIYDNIKNAFNFILAVHLPIAGLGLIPVLMGWPLLLYPLHVMFLEFVIDPACSFVFEADGNHATSMRQPPRTAIDGLFTRAAMFRNLLRGGIILLADIAVYALALQWLSVDTARTLGFTATIANTVALIFISRERSFSARDETRINMSLWLVSGLTLLLLGVVIYVPPVAHLFGFVTPPAIGMTLVALVTAIVWWLLHSLRIKTL